MGCAVNRSSFVSKPMSRYPILARVDYHDHLERNVQRSSKRVFCIVSVGCGASLELCRDPFAESKHITFL